jgi:hypothetical protein
MSDERGTPLILSLLSNRQITADDLVAALRQAISEGASLSSDSEETLEDIFFNLTGGDDGR